VGKLFRGRGVEGRGTHRRAVDSLLLTGDAAGPCRNITF
jgi:hypothetical protein